MRAFMNTSPAMREASRNGVHEYYTDMEQSTIVAFDTAIPLRWDIKHFLWKARSGHSQHFEAPMIQHNTARGEETLSSVISIFSHLSVAA